MKASNLIYIAVSFTQISKVDGLWRVLTDSYRAMDHFPFTLNISKGKGKVIPLRARCGPEGG